MQSSPTINTTSITDDFHRCSFSSQEGSRGEGVRYRNRPTESDPQFAGRVAEKICNDVMAQLKDRLGEDKIPSRSAHQLTIDILHRTNQSLIKKVVDHPRNPDRWDWKAFDIPIAGIGFEFEKARQLNNLLTREDLRAIFEGVYLKGQSIVADLSCKEREACVFSKLDCNFHFILDIEKNAYQMPRLSQYIKAAIQAGVLSEENINQLHALGPSTGN